MTTIHEPVIAEAADGLVHIVCESAMAKRLSNALEHAYQATYLLDCSAISNAAVAADIQNRTLPDTTVRYVPLNRSGQRHLSVVGGEV